MVSRAWTVKQASLLPRRALAIVLTVTLTHIVNPEVLNAFVMLAIAEMRALVFNVL